MNETPGGEALPPEQPLATRVVRGSLLVAGASYFTILLGFSATIIMTRLVSPRDFGVLAIATVLFGFLNLRAKVGLAQAFVRDPTTDGRTCGTVFVLDLASASLSLALALILIPVFRILGYAQDVVLVILALALLGLVDALGTTPALLLDKGLFLGYTTVTSAASLALSYIPSILLALNGFGVWSLVTQLALQTAINAIGFWYLAYRVVGKPVRVRWRFDLDLGRRYLRFGMVLGGALLAGFLTTYFDNFLVGTFVGLATLGFYDRAYRFASWPNLLISNVIARTSFLTYARLQDDRVRLSKTFDMTLWIITTLALPLVLVIFVTAPDLIEFLIGPQWLPSAVFLRFLVIFSLIRPFQDDIGGLLTTLGKPHLVSAAAWVETGALVIFASFLTFEFGAIGTAIGVGIAFIFGGTLYYYWAAKSVDIVWGRALGLPALATVLTLLCYLLFNQLLDWKDLVLTFRLALKILFTLFAFGTFTLLIQSDSFIERTRYVWRLARGGDGQITKKIPTVQR